MLFASCKPQQHQALLQPCEALGTVLAEEAARAAGPKKQVAIISPDAHWGAVSTVEQAFRDAMRKQGFTVVIAKAANLGDPMRRGPVGLKVADFLEALDKSSDAGVIVSLAGAPLLGPGEAARARPDHPPVLVVATGSLGNVPGLWCDPLQVARLLEAKIVQLAIVDGGLASDAPPAGKTDATHQLFAQNYHVLRVERAN